MWWKELYFVSIAMVITGIVAIVLYLLEGHGRTYYEYTLLYFILKIQIND